MSGGWAGGDGGGEQADDATRFLMASLSLFRRCVNMCVEVVRVEELGGGKMEYEDGKDMSLLMSSNGGGITGDGCTVHGYVE